MDADDILVLKDGMIAETGTHSQLLATKDSLYADMWHRQMEIDTGEKDEVEAVAVEVGGVEGLKTSNGR